MNPDLVIVYRSPADLLPYKNNARTHSPEQIASIRAAMREFGFTNPILLKDDEQTIGAGHARWEAASAEGFTSVPTITLRGLSEQQWRAYVLADNRLALNAGWDLELLRVELTDLQAFDFDLGLTGFSDDELAALTADKTGGLTDPDAVPEVPVDPVARPGDVWLLGRHRLVCGDSTSVDDMEKLTAGQLVDMWLTDPPYNVAYEGGTRDKLTIRNDNMGNDEFRQFLRDACVTAGTVMKPGAVFYIWHADSEGYNFRGAAIDAGWKVRQCLIWKKSSQVMGRQDYHWKHEPCLYGWKDGAGHLWASDRKQTTILEFDKPSRNGEHPTMKPVALFEYQMLNNTRGGDIVLDSFGGSGTTLIAAEKNGRLARLMELDPRYCDVIIKRWQEFTGQQATREGDGRTFEEVATVRIEELNDEARPKTQADPSEADRGQPRQAAAQPERGHRAGGAAGAAAASGR